MGDGRKISGRTQNVQRSDDPHTHACNSIALGSEECIGFATTSYEFAKPRITDRPIFLIGDQTLGHLRLLFGDTRDPRWGEHNTVSQDAWHPLASACVLSQAQFSNPNFGQTWNVYYSSIDAKHGPPPDFHPPLPCSALPSDETLNQNQIENNDLPIGKKFAASLMEPASTTFHTTTGTIDSSTIYFDGQGNEGQFGLLPKNMVDSYLDAHNELSAHAEFGKAYLSEVAEWPHTPPEEDLEGTASLVWPTAVREALDPIFPEWDWTADDSLTTLSNQLSTIASDDPKKTSVLFKALLENLGHWPESTQIQDEKLSVIECITLNIDALNNAQRQNVIQSIPTAIHHLSNVDHKREIIKDVLDLIDEVDQLPPQGHWFPQSILNALNSIPLNQEDRNFLCEYATEKFGAPGSHMEVDQ